MKARRYLLYSILLIALFGVVASECGENPQGIYFRINRHGEDYQRYGSLPRYYDGWLFPSYTLLGVGLFGTATDLVFVDCTDYSYDGYDVQLRRINGTVVWSSGSAEGPHRVSWDGNYIYSGNTRRFLSDFERKETVLPDSLIENMYLGNISDDNRYLCYYNSPSSGDTINIMLWDDLKKEHHSIQRTYVDRFGGAFYASSRDRIYYLVDHELWSLKPDGSQASHVYAFPASSNPQGCNLLPGEQSFLLWESGEICEFNLDQNAITRRVGGFHSYRYAPLSKELYLMADNTVSRYDMETEELSVIYRAGKHGQTLGYGFGCSMDG
ncbi:MAG TPA: hypothetical protein PLX77_06525, partial [Candidatus Cloacimonadota bacterium]|nr:hypothetical protein [Candidatus Cloacimonadota bacterium]